MAGKPGMFNGNPGRHNNTSKYHGLDPYALRHFKMMHDRILTPRHKAKGRGTDFPRTRQGYIDFCAEIGPIPSTISHASVGRRNHFYGYIRGNIRWEEYKTNRNKGNRVNEAIEMEPEEPPF